MNPGRISFLFSSFFAVSFVGGRRRRRRAIIFFFVGTNHRLRLSPRLVCASFASVFLRP